MANPIMNNPPAVASPGLRDIKDLPGPRGLPIAGNALQIEQPRFHLQMEDWARQYGPLYKFSVGSRRFLVLADHALVAAMLRDRPDGFRRPDHAARIGQELGIPGGVFRANGDEWRRQRRMVMAGFDPTHVKRYYPSMVSVGQRLAGRWTKAANAGLPINLQSDLMRYTVDTIAGLAFGADVNTLESDGYVIQQQLDKIFPALFKRMMAPLPLWRWHKTAADKRIEQDVADVMKAVDGFIAQARQRMTDDPSLREHPRNLLEAMIVAADQPDSGIDNSQVAGNVITLLLAGEDTTANTLAWAIHLLWRHQDVLRRATDEVRGNCDDATAPTLEQLATLDYVEACINETMRLKPVGPIIALQAARDMTIADVHVPKDTIVWGLMRHDGISEQFVPRADEFDPLRWLTAAAESPATSGTVASTPSSSSAAPMAAATSAKRLSMPFGAGPRICPGRYLAMLEMKLALATLLGRFDIQSVDTPDGRAAREHLAFSMAPVGLTMRLTNRAELRAAALPV